jgi:hypothetical protein
MFFLVGIAGLLPLQAAEPTRHVLSSVTENLNPASVKITQQDAAPSCPVRWSVTKRRLSGGKQDGVDVIVLDNGKLAITVVPTRGMGIWSVKQGDLRIGWDSPVDEIVHPKYVNLNSRGGLGWLDGFGEWMCRCGLENNGHPGVDTIISNTGEESSIDLTLHGKQAYLPAQEVELLVQREAPYALRLRGIVYERMMHGPKLKLTTEIVTVPGEASFRIVDEISNQSALEAEYQILYHTNFGAPVLEEGAQFFAPLKQVTPFNDRAAEGDIHQFASYSGPQDGFVEQVYCLRPYGDDKGQTCILMQNRAADVGVSMCYSLEALPYLTLWKNVAAVEDGYVTGIEPGTNFPFNRGHERKAGRVPKLAPHGKQRIEIVVAVHTTSADVDKVRQQIAAIQDDRSTQYDAQPEPEADSE